MGLAGTCALVAGLSAAALGPATTAAATARPTTASSVGTVGQLAHLPQGHLPLRQLAAFDVRAAAATERLDQLGSKGLLTARHDASNSRALAQPHIAEAAATFSVNSTADDPLASSTSTSCRATNGKCTLRAAVQAADNLGKAVDIKLSSQDYVLSDTTAGVMLVTDPGAISITGTSPSKTTISVKSGDDIEPFGVSQNLKTQGGVLFLSGLTIEGGSAASGGALVVADPNSSAVLTDVDLQSNLATVSGGAIASEGHLWVTDSTIKDNQAAEDAGGIITEADGSLVLTDSTITGNSTVGEGGGLAVSEGVATIVGGTVSSNTSGTSSGPGGGGGILAIDASVTLNGTNVTSNKVLDEGVGGGIGASEAVIVMQGGQLSHNSAAAGLGGAGYLVSTTATLTKVTTDSNTGAVGGIVTMSENAIPTTVDIVGGSIAHNSSGALLAYSDSAGSTTGLDISGAVLDSNETTHSGALPCGAAVCAVGLSGGVVQLTLSKDTVDNNSATPKSELGGAVEVISSGAGSASADLQGDTIDDDSAASATMSAGAVLFASLSSSSDYSPLTLSVTGSTFEHDSVGGGGQGGAIGISTFTGSGITSDTSVTMSDDTFEHDTAGTSKSTADSGGGALSISPSTTGSVTGSTFRDNEAEGTKGAGGAVLEISDGSFAFANDSFTSNFALLGGAFAVQGGTTTIDQCSLSGNTAGEGGSAVAFFEAMFSITRSTFSGNVDKGGGKYGAVLLLGSFGTIANSTLTGNSAGKTGLGGAIFVTESQLTLNSDTITANVAKTGSALYTDQSGQGVTVEDSIISHNTTTAGGGSENDCGLSAGSPGAIAAASEGGNVLGSSKCVVQLAGNDKVTKNPKLDSLGKNGGPTETMALESGAPALKLDLACLPTDQRGTARPSSKCDAGAYELTKA